MTTKKLSNKFVTFAFVALGVWVIVYTLGGYKWYEMDSKELASVQGCYFVQGKQLFRITGKSILSTDESWGFEGKHEKSRDALELDRPLQISREGKLQAASNTSKVGINYGPPLKLELWNDGDQPVQAVKAPCIR